MLEMLRMSEMSRISETGYLQPDSLVLQLEHYSALSLPEISLAL